MLTPQALLLAGLAATAVQAACLPPYKATYSSLGCYSDNDSRTLTGPEVVLSSTNSAQNCANSCGLGGYKYAATEYGTQCYCGNTISAPGAPAASGSCNMACAGNSTEMCGGTWFMNMYQVTNPSSSSSPANVGLPDCTRDPLCSNPICDTSLSTAQRVAGLISNMTLAEKAANMMNAAPGVSSLGLPAYNWWSEALHGVAGSPGVSFSTPNGSDFSFATSFPEPILMGATFDDALINQIASVVGTEGRAFGNNGHSGFDFWTPNINPFRDPRWGRGLEVPGEDPFHLSRYVYSLVTGLQGGVDPPVKKVIATCKHFAVYDIEENRNGDDLDPTPQDLYEYYLLPFKSCARDAKVGAVMCSYNAEYGIPSCANRFLLQNVLRESWGWSQPYNWITSDCAAVSNIESPHKYVATDADAAAVALNAGTDLACEGTIYNSLVQAVAQNTTNLATVDKSLTRLYTSLVQVGYFNPPADLAAIGWKDVSTPAAQHLAYLAAVEGITLLKNDGALPLAKDTPNVAVIGPWGNATTQMQGNYQGTAPFLVSPLQAFQSGWSGHVTYAQGTAINSASTSGFAAALSAAQAADVIVYCGGIDTSIEAEGMDRTTIAWTGNQLQLIGELAALGKKLIVVQFGGGQLDGSSLLSNKGVNALVWAGYPGQDGGNALRDALDATYPISGRLPVTQYPANYISQVNKWDPNLRPNSTTGSPGRTYMWYPTPVLPFGYGLHYTNFSFSLGCSIPSKVSIASLFQKAAGSTYPGKANFTTVTVNVANKGSLASDYVALLFLSTKNAGPAPYPIKTLAGYARAFSIAADATARVKVTITLASLARADADGNFWIYPGDYTVSLDTYGALNFTFSLTGTVTMLEGVPGIPHNPQPLEYLGCFSGSAPLSGGPTSTMGSNNAPQACADSCAAAGYHFSGVQGS